MKNFQKTGRLIRVNILLCILSVLIGCNPTVEIEPTDTEQTHYYKTYSSTQASLGRFVDELPNGEIIIAGSNQDPTIDIPDEIFIRKLDADGNTIWDKTIKTNKPFFCQGIRMSNGDYVLNSIFVSTEVIRVNSEGEIIYHIEFNPDLPGNNIIALPVEGENGSVLVSHTNGAGNGQTSDNYIYTFNENGDTENISKFFNGQFGGKIITYQVVTRKGDFTIVTGTMYEYPWTSWSNARKTFVAKVKPNAAATVIVKDSKDTKTSMHRLSLLSKDDHVLYASTQSSFYFNNDIPGPQSSFDFVKMTTDLNSVWSKTIELDVLTLEPISLTENNKGEFVITGECSVVGSNGRLPFVVKIGANGEVLFKKIFRLAESVVFHYGLQLNDGSYLMTGATAGFGKAREYDNLVIMKSDETGER